MMALEVTRALSPGSPNLPYALVTPGKLDLGAPLLVCVHGISRNTDEIIEAFAPVAAARGMATVAPVFGELEYPDYQRLGRLGRGPRADFALDRAVAEVRQRLGIVSRDLLLFGFSGGGQLVHRYAFAHPKRVRAVVVASSGWYTLPDTSQKYPKGLQRTARLPGVRFDVARALGVPALVVVGANDTDRDPSMRQGSRLDRVQGRHRVDRARNWVRTMQLAAQEHGVSARVELVEIPDVAHSFAAMANAGMCRLALDFMRNTESYRATASSPNSERVTR